MNYSIECFPPRTKEIQARLNNCLDAFAKYSPDYFSVTFGAGGSTLNQTADTVKWIHDKTAVPVAPHLTCMGLTKIQICSLLDEYKAQGIKRIIALRGDMPSGMHDPGELSYANELVELIRHHWGDDVHISVSAYPEYHPQAKSPEHDFNCFVQKAKSGANDAITQYFFNPNAYIDFVERAHKVGVQIPIIPGIMPITNFKQIKRFSDMCGADLPRWIAKKLEYYDNAGDKSSLKAFGLDVVTKLCEQLQALGAPGMHFYSLNRHESVCAILDNLSNMTHNNAIKK